MSEDHQVNDKAVQVCWYHGPWRLARWPNVEGPALTLALYASSLVRVWTVLLRDLDAELASTGLGPHHILAEGQVPTSSVTTVSDGTRFSAAVGDRLSLGVAIVSNLP